MPILAADIMTVPISTTVDDDACDDEDLKNSEHVNYPRGTGLTHDDGDDFEKTEPILKL